MSLEAQIHRHVLGLDGVAVVYAADPVWLVAAKHLGGLLTPGVEPDGGPFVVCTEEPRPQGEEAATEAVGPSGDGEQLLADMRPVLAVRVRIGTSGGAAAPDVARRVAAEIRSFAAAHRPGLDIKAVVEIAAIDV